MIKKYLVFSILLLVLVTTGLSAQESMTREEFAENLEVSMVVIGAADALYSWWGHVAWIVENTETGASRAYDYGNFSFEQEAFLKNFIMGQMDYLKMASDPERMLRNNVFLNRTITLYTLNAAPLDRLRLLELLENDIRPENRTYRYNLFWDNCSTRIRDRMDILTDSQFSKKYMVPSDKTLRMQLRRFLYSNVFMDWLLNFALSGVTDRTATEWDGMFLPEELGRAVETMMVRDANGNMVPFVSGKTIYNTAVGRPEVADYPPPNWYYGAIAGFVLAALAFLLKGKGETVFSLVFSFIFAVFGSLLFFMSVFTDHNYSYWNMNLLLVNPFMFVIFAFSIRQLVKKSASMRLLRIFWMVIVVGCLLSIILKIVPFFRQDNWETLLLVLLPAIVMSGIPAAGKKLFARRKE